MVCCLACDRSPRTNETIFCAASLGRFIETIDLKDMATQIGGSRTLVLQVQAGAKADLLLLADELSEELKGHGPKSSKFFAQNTLVLVTRRDKTDWPGLADATGRLAVADSKSAPLGHYTEQFLRHQKFGSQLVPLKDASAVATAVRLGHVEAGVLYRSDLSLQDDLIEAAAVPPELHDPIRYQAILFESANPKAKALFDWLSSAEGKKSLREAGFDA